MEITVGENLILKFEGNTCSLSPSNSMSISQTNFPPSFSYFPKKCYVSFRVLDYDNKQLKAEIIEYCIGDIPFAELQMSLATELAEIQKIEFNRLATGELLKFRQGLTAQMPQYSNRPKQVARLPIHWNDTIEIPFNNITFEDNRISFSTTLPITSKESTLYIYNSFIKKEFEAIKGYFSNALKAKSIAVSIKITTDGVHILQEEATSEVISRINETILGQIRINAIRTILRHSPENGNQILHSFEETLAEANVPATLINSEEQFMESISMVAESKHFRHLQFLAQEHKHELLKLQFVFTPISFCFLLEGRNGYYFIWETVDTEEATYTWKFPKNVEEISAFKKSIERELTVIVADGKKSYLTNKPESFKRIIHNYTEKDSGFSDWKEQIFDLLS